MKSNLSEGVKVNPKIIKSMFDKHSKDFACGFELEYIMQNVETKYEVGNVENMDWETFSSYVASYDDDTHTLKSYFERNYYQLENEYYGFDFDGKKEKYTDDFENNVRHYFTSFEDLDDQQEIDDAIQFLTEHDPDYTSPQGGVDFNDESAVEELEQQVESLKRRISDGVLPDPDGNTLGEYVRYEIIDDASREIDISQFWDEREDSYQDVMDAFSIQLVQGAEIDEYDDLMIDDDGGDVIGSGGMEQQLNELTDFIDDSDGWDIVGDPSIDTQGEGIGGEIVSPKMDLEEMFEVFPKCLEFIKRTGITNDSCGVHVSLSFTSNKGIDDIDWVKLAVLSGEEWMLDQFGRANNKYTVSQKDIIQRALAGNQDLSKTPLGDLIDELNRSDLLREKYSTFNIKSFEIYGGRIEFRIMGSKDYEYRGNTMLEQVARYVMFLVIAADDQLFRKEYYKKLAGLINRPMDSKVSKQYADNPYYRAWARRYPAIRSFQQMNINTAPLEFVGYTASLVARDNLKSMQTEDMNPQLNQKLMAGLIESLDLEEETSWYVANSAYVRGYTERKAIRELRYQRTSHGVTYSGVKPRASILYAYYMAYPNSEVVKKQQKYSDALSSLTGIIGVELDQYIDEIINELVFKPYNDRFQKISDFCTKVIMRYGHIGGVVPNVMKVMYATGSDEKQIDSVLRAKLPARVYYFYFDEDSNTDVSGKISPLAQQAIEQSQNGNSNGEYNTNIATKFAVGLLMEPVDETLIDPFLQIAIFQLSNSRALPASRGEITLNPQETNVVKYWNTFLNMVRKNIDDSEISNDQKRIWERITAVSTDALRLSS